jgi:hypothetical protein
MKMGSYSKPLQLAFALKGRCNEIISSNNSIWATDPWVEAYVKYRFDFGQIFEYEIADFVISGVVNDTFGHKKLFLFKEASTFQKEGPLVNGDIFTGRVFVNTHHW